MAGRKVLVIIGYAPHGQGVEPADLQVFGKQITDPDDPDLTGLYDTSRVDDETGLTEITCSPRKRRYRFNVQALPDGQLWIFAAVFRNSNGIGGINQVISNVVRIDTSEPTAADNWSVI